MFSGDRTCQHKPYLCLEYWRWIEAKHQSSVEMNSQLATYVSARLTPLSFTSSYLRWQQVILLNQLPEQVFGYSMPVP